MSYFSKFAARMGIVSRDNRRKMDESTSNTSLSNMRYVLTEKPKWKVFRKKELVPIPVYPTRKTTKGCPCGSDGPCKQKVTPKGVTIHYPQKKRTAFPSFASKKRIIKPKIDRGFYNTRFHCSKPDWLNPKKLKLPPIKSIKKKITPKKKGRAIRSMDFIFMPFFS